MSMLICIGVVWVRTRILDLKIQTEHIFFVRVNLDDFPELKQ
jgi:hypothetical protein